MNSKRNRNKGRTLETYNNKLTKITLLFNRLTKTSKKSKEVYLAAPEADRKPKEKIFFFEKYTDLTKFLACNKLREVKK